MVNYFKDCKTAEQGKKLYRKLAKEFHPDNCNGSVDKMQELNSQYEKWWSTHKDIHQNQKTGETYRKETTETAEEFIDIVSALYTLSKDIDIEVCGTWLWIHGNTYPIKDQIKNLGCRWSKGHKKWYWTSEPYIKTKYHLSEAQIRARYGSEFIAKQSARVCIE